MKNSTLVYKSAIILLGIVLPFILPAHRFPSFYCKSCIWWYCPYLILRTAEPSSREKNKMKEEIKIFLNFTKEQWRPTLHRNWLKTENCFPPDFKTGWKEILFHQQQHLSPLPVRSTAGWLAKLQNRTPMAPPRTDVCNSNCSTPVSLLQLLPGKSHKTFLLVCHETESESNLRIQSLPLNHRKADHGKPWCCRRVGAHKPYTQTLLESGCKHICTCPAFQRLSSCQWRAAIGEVQPPCYRLWNGMNWTRKQYSLSSQVQSWKKWTNLPSYTCSLSNHGSHLAFNSTSLTKKSLRAGWKPFKVTTFSQVPNLLNLQRANIFTMQNVAWANPFIQPEDTKLNTYKVMQI